MLSFSGAMLWLTAFALFIFAFAELREGRLGAALMLGLLAVLMCSMAAAVAG